MLVYSQLHLPASLRSYHSLASVSDCVNPPPSAGLAHQLAASPKMQGYEGCEGTPLVLPGLLLGNAVAGLAERLHGEGDQRCGGSQATF